VNIFAQRTLGNAHGNIEGRGLVFDTIFDRAIRQRDLDGVVW